MTSSDAATGQVNVPAAEVYEHFFVPALFDQWPDQVLESAGVSGGDDVLDVGCGTGVLARAAARRLTGTGSVVGIDINEGMLVVARRASEAVTWQAAAAEDLPFPNDSFDRVVSQFALMFFRDRARAVREMARVVRPHGTVTVATWASVEESPGYAAMVALLRRLFGEPAAAALRAPFTIGSADTLRAVLGEAFRDVSVTRTVGEARFDSIEAWVNTEVRGWTLADMIDDDQHAVLLNAATTDLADFVDAAGRVRFSVPALIATTTPQAHHPR